MAKKKLSPEQLNKMETFLKQGKTPEDLSNYFKVAISSIHNYKRALKNKGIELPNIRGQRPKGIVESNNTIPILSELAKDLVMLKSYIHLIVNKTDFFIKSTAKAIRVDDNQVVIEF